MDVKEIKVGEDGKELGKIPCNVCDGEFDRDGYSGTKSGICIQCRNKKKPGDIEAIYFITNEIHKSYQSNKKKFNWFTARKTIKTLYIMVDDKNFISNIGPYLVKRGLANSEIMRCVDTFIKIRSDQI